MTTLQQLIRFEEALLLIEKRHKNNELQLKFDTLVKLEEELDKIGKITNIYLKEIERLVTTKVDNLNERKNEMLETLIDYDCTTYESILMSKEVQTYYNL